MCKIRLTLNWRKVLISSHSLARFTSESVAHWYPGVAGSPNSYAMGSNVYDRSSTFCTTDGYQNGIVQTVQHYFSN
jgi:hypothetical protein